MDKTTLENELLLVEVDAHGAELVRIYDKKRGREVLWDAKPEIWPRHAPILFPFVGNCFEGKYQYKGTFYPMTAHGFARDHEFTLVSATDTEVWYEFHDSEKTYENYPFHFSLQLGHRLEGNQIHVMWKVVNTDSKELLFMIGGHPAFVTPEGHDIYDFTFKFDCQTPLHYQAPNDLGYGDAAKQGTLDLKNGEIPLTKGFFDEVLTYIFDDAQVNSVSLLLPGEEPYVTVHCKDIPLLGVWTKEETHPFVCLEPWFGRCADQGFDGELEDRAGVNKLETGKTFQAEYVIEIH